MRRQWLQQRFANGLAQQIPDDIARLAHEQHLGTPQAGYAITKLHRYWRWPQYMAPFAIAFVSITFFLSYSNIGSDLFLLNMLLMLLSTLSFFALSLVLMFAQMQCAFYICTEGLILNQSVTRLQPQHRILRWDEITTIWYTSARPISRLFFKSRIYTIRSQDGSTLMLTGLRKTLETLDALLEREFTRRRLPFQLADFRAGQRLSFGSTSIDTQGIYALDRLLPWSQVADIALEEDQRLVISQIGDPPQKWQSFPIQKIPNLSLLLALVQRVRNGQSEQEAALQTLAAYGGPTVIAQNRRRIDPLPEELAALAGERQLGERRLDQDLGRSRLASWVVIGALAGFEIICAIFDVVVIKGYLSSPGFSFLFSSLFTCTFYTFLPTVLGMVNLIHQLQQIHTRTYTFEHGMVFQRARRTPVVFRWEEVEAVWRRPAFFAGQQNQQASQYQSAYACTLQLRDGTKHTFTRLNIKQQALSRIVREQIVPLQLPAVIAAYQAGQAITFGPAQLSQQGIALNGRGLPWSQVRSVRLQGNRLVVFDLARRKPWGKLDARRVPNLFLLFALADFARTGSLCGNAS